MHLYLHLTVEALVTLQSVSFIQARGFLSHHFLMSTAFKAEWTLKLKHTSAMASIFDNAIGRSSQIGRGFADAQSSFYHLHVLMAVAHGVKVIVSCYTLFVLPQLMAGTFSFEGVSLQIFLYQ